MHPINPYILPGIDINTTLPMALLFACELANADAEDVFSKAKNPRNTMAKALYTHYLHSQGYHPEKIAAEIHRDRCTVLYYLQLDRKKYIFKNHLQKFRSVMGF